MSRSAPLGAPDEARNVLAITPFRRLWISLSLSSLGDWLSLLALISLAAVFTADSSALVQYMAVSGVVVIKLAPSIVLSPLAGLLADRLDRRWTMVVGDVLRALLYVSIPLVGLFFPGFALEWLFIAGFLAEVVEQFRTCAQDASVPTLVPRKKLEQANRLNLLATYGSAPVAALLFAVLASVSSVLGALMPAMAYPESDVALYLNGLVFLVAAIVVAGLPIPKHKPAKGSESDTRDAGILRSIWTGRRHAGGSPLMRGLVLGMLGTVFAGGVVIGVARIHVEVLGAGNAGFGVVFASVFAGMALGMLAGPRILKQFSRRRLFGVSVALAGLALLLAGAIGDMVLTAVLAFLLGVGAGVAWMIGLTLFGHEVEDEYRGGAFAFLHGTARVVLVAAAGLAPLVAGLIGDYAIPVGPLTYDLRGSGLVLMVSGLLAALLAWICYRQMTRDDPEAGPGLVPELVAALRGVEIKEEEEEDTRPSGAFIVMEGGEGAGKSTQVRELTVWLREQGFEVVGTRQPGATKLGMRLRGLLLDRENSHITPRAEVLLYAADKADHVEQEILPALRRGAIVISDRYVDSLLAYQGVGRDLPTDEIGDISGWATQGLVPDLTVLLDVRPEDGLARLGGPADRIESESLDFHNRVRKGFLALAKKDPERYLVVDAAEPAEKIGKEIRRRVRTLLPDPVPSSAEAVTGMIPVIRND